MLRTFSALYRAPIDIIATSLCAPTLDDNRRSSRSTRRALILIPIYDRQAAQSIRSYPQILWITVCKKAPHWQRGPDYWHRSQIEHFLFKENNIVGSMA